MERHVPVLWSAAHESRRPAPVRWAGRGLLRLLDLARALALADHHTFVSH
ncbi:hypothetical protein ACFFV7_00245 [Nonomuraea spiralis]|uniref:Uncharacterized protein n=1 Tax=Nonomuraea spiralis TaxID=46182 RepID=A0ABV5I4Z2_9ACTN|nr:hypothetical protein [Nonomuraea spiralis]